MTITGLIIACIFTACTGIWIALIIGEEHEDGDADRAAAERLTEKIGELGGDIDRALTILCDPCHGRPGTCKCTSNLLCDNDDCPAPDTTVLTGADVAWLRSISVAEGES